MKKIIQLPFIPLNNDLALLVLRIWTGISLFGKHGIEKFTNFSQMSQHFPDPLHIGPTFGLTFSLITDGICSVLILLGLFTRLASLFIVINLLVVFITMHHFSFGEDHAELVYVYLGCFISLLFAGAGKYSIDNRL